MTDFNHIQETKKKLCDLNVIELRYQLQKRGLNRMGVKSILLERLKKAIVKEGKNPDEYFDEILIKRFSRKPLPKNGKKDFEDIEEKEQKDKNKTVCEKKNALFAGMQLSQANLETSINANITAKQDSLGKFVASDRKTVVLKSGNISDDKSSVRKIPDLFQKENHLFKTSSTFDFNFYTLKTNFKNKLSLFPSSFLSDSQTCKETLAKQKINSSNIIWSIENLTAMTKQKSVEKEKSIDCSENEDTKSDGKTLFVTGLNKKTKTSDLRSLFNKMGKVLKTKIVTRAKTVGAEYYGLITMSTSKEAELCIEKLNNSKLNGRIIMIEKIDKDTLGSSKKTEVKIVEENNKSKSKSKKKKSIKTKSEEAKFMNKKALKVTELKEDMKKELKSIKTRTPSEERQRRDISRDRIRRQRSYLAELCDLLSME